MRCCRGLSNCCVPNRWHWMMTEPCTEHSWWARSRRFLRSRRAARSRRSSISHFPNSFSQELLCGFSVQAVQRSSRCTGFLVAPRSSNCLHSESAEKQPRRAFEVKGQEGREVLDGRRSWQLVSLFFGNSSSCFKFYLRNALKIATRALPGLHGLPLPMQFRPHCSYTKLNRT